MYKICIEMCLQSVFIYIFKDQWWEIIFLYLSIYISIYYISLKPSKELLVEIQMIFNIELDTAKLKVALHLLCPCILR